MIHCWKTSEKAMLRVLSPSFKLFLEQIRMLKAAWILTSDWIKLRGSHARNGCYVTCCKANLLWVSKTRNMYRCPPLSATTFRNLICCKTGLIRGWSNAQHRYSIRFAAMFQKQVARFFLSVLSRPFLHVYRVAGSFWWSALHPLTKTFKCQTGKWWRNMKEIVTLFFVFLIQWQKCMQMKVSTRLKEAFDRWQMFKVSQNR